jgi:hypothetical protein
MEFKGNCQAVSGRTGYASGSHKLCERMWPGFERCKYSYGFI